MTPTRMEARVQRLTQDPHAGTAHYMLDDEYFKAQKRAGAVRCRLPKS